MHINKILKFYYTALPNNLKKLHFIMRKCHEDSFTIVYSMFKMCNEEEDSHT